MGQFAAANWGVCSGTVPIGTSAPLSEDGYLAVAKTCCNREMYDFVRRTISSMSMEVCDEGGLMGLVPWFTCETAGVMKSKPDPTYTGSFVELQQVLQANQRPTKCFFVAQKGSCEAWPVQDQAECGGR